ncbi:hypothetical protein [Sphingobacterium siyangense]|uniref:hypothetical protein n=1 Tax=Sphingobacterium siyangense TaxID=459529 RepID=UPI001963FE5A|nr:hypothetical protein [Sphingobacterium siyangense]QRY57233.1 hypothetical protein JVX97_25105 [Sphingobacterium siyangense]
MEAVEFVESLRNIYIDASLLKKQGVSDEYIEHIKRAYIVMPKERTIVSQYSIIELVENYDCSHLEIGMVSFEEKTEEISNFIYFGKAYGHDLAIDTTTGAIVVVESGSENLLFKCAQNDKSFLSSTFNVALFLERRAVEEDLYENVELNIQMAEEFGDIAGGKLYYDFYKMMLGV